MASAQKLLGRYFVLIMLRTMLSIVLFPFSHAILLWCVSWCQLMYYSIFFAGVLRCIWGVFFTSICPTLIEYPLCFSVMALNSLNLSSTAFFFLFLFLRKYTRSFYWNHQRRDKISVFFKRCDLNWTDYTTCTSCSCFVALLVFPLLSVLLFFHAAFT